MPNYHHKSKIVKREEIIPDGRLKEGMIVSFRYKGGSDKSPLVLVLYNDRDKKMIEGINLNYLNLDRVTRLFEIMVEQKVKVNKDEVIEDFESDITRVQLSSFKIKDNTTPPRFYRETIKSDSIIKSAYRSYYLTKMSLLKAADIQENLLG